MKVLKRVLIREVHISHREIEVDENATEEEIIRAGLENGDEVFCEYSHTMNESNHTIENIEPRAPATESPSEVLRRLMYSQREQ